VLQRNKKMKQLLPFNDEFSHLTGCDPLDAFFYFFIEEEIIQSSRLELLILVGMTPPSYLSLPKED
jgi:hypothetical protein